MPNNPTDIELSVKLSSEDVKKSAQDLDKSIKDVFEKSSGKALDSKMKNLQKEMGGAAAKADELVKKMEALENTKIPTEDYINVQKEIDKATKALSDFQSKSAGKVTELQQKMTELAGKQIPTEAYKDLADYIEKAEGQLEKLGNTSIKLQKGAQTEKVKQRLEDIDHEAERLQGHIAQAEDKMQELVDKGKAFTLGSDTAEYQKLQQELDGINSKSEELSNNLKNANDNMNNLVVSGRDFTLGSDSEQYSKLSNSLADVNNKSRVLIERWNEQNNAAERTNQTNERLHNTTMKLAASTGVIARSMRSTAKNSKALEREKRKLNNTTKTLAKTTKTAAAAQDHLNFNFKKGITTLIRYGLGISGLFVLFNKLRGAAIDGINSIAAWKDGSNETNKSLSMIASSLATLKNSLGALVAVILNAIAPAIDKIINLMISGINYANQFISALMGKKTYLKAERVNVNYAESLGLIAKKAKEAQAALQGYLSPLDEINQYTKNADMEDDSILDGIKFTETPIDPKLLNIIDKIRDKLQDLWNWLQPILKKLLDRLKQLWDKFKQGFKDALGDWRKPLGLILDGVKRIGQALKDIFTDPEVLAAWNRYLDSVAYLLGTLAGTALRIGLNIGANLAQGIARALEEKKDEIKEYLIEMFDIGTHINTQLAKFLQALGEISDVLIGENAIRATSELVQIFMETFMLLAENLARFADRVIWTVTQPIIDNVELIKQRLDEAFGMLADVFNTIEQRIYGLRMWLKELWKDHLDPLFESIEKHLDEILQLTLNTLFPDTIKFITDLLNVVSDVLIRITEKLLSGIVNILETIEPYVAEFVKQCILELDSIVKFLDEKLWEIKAWFDELWDEHLSPLFDAITQDINEILVLLFDTLFPNIVSMLGDLFRTITETITNIAEAVVEGFVRVAEQTHDQITETATFVIGKLNEIIEHIDTELIPAIGTIGQAFASEEMKQAIEEFGILVVNVVTGVLEELSRLVEQAVDSVTTIIEDNAQKIETFIKGILDLFGDLSETINNIVTDVREILDDLWKNHLEPFFDKLTEIVSKLVGAILDSWNKEIKPMLDEAIGELQNMWDNYIKPFVEYITENIMYIAELLLDRYSNVLAPLFNWFISTVIPNIIEAVGMAKDAVSLALKVVFTELDLLMGLLHALLEFIQTLFTQGWNEAWRGLAENFGEIWEGMKERLKGILNGMIDLVNGAINIIGNVWNGLVDAISGVTIDIPDWVPFGLGGNTFSLGDLPRVPDNPIPHLARGAVIPPNQEFLAMLGDQKSGTNIETPLNTMLEAFRQALSENGNNNLTLNLLLPNKQVVAQYVIDGGRVLQTSKGRNPFDLSVN